MRYSRVRGSRDLKANVNEPYGNNVDMFSCGVVAYTLLFGYEPFYGADEHELMIANKNIEYEFHYPECNTVSQCAKDWIARTLCDASVRMTPEEAISHPWLQQARHLSDMRILARLRRAITSDKVPSETLNRSSHHFLSSRKHRDNRGGGHFNGSCSSVDGTSAKKSSFQLQTEETSSMVASKYRKYEKAALALSKGSFQEFPGPSLAIVSRSDGSPGAARAGEWWSADLNASFDSEEEDMSNAQERSCVIA